MLNVGRKVGSFPKSNNRHEDKLPKSNNRHEDANSAIAVFFKVFKE